MAGQVSEYANYVLELIREIAGAPPPSLPAGAIPHGDAAVDRAQAVALHSRRGGAADGRRPTALHEGREQ